MIDGVAQSATRAIYEQYLVNKMGREKEQRDFGFVGGSTADPNQSAASPNINALENRDHDYTFGIADFCSPHKQLCQDPAHDPLIDQAHLDKLFADFKLKCDELTGNRKYTNPKKDKDE